MAATASPPTMVIQDDYIDMDLTPTATPHQPSSPRFEFQSAGAGCGGCGGGKNREETFASPADELFYKGNLLPLHLPPRLQLVQRLLFQEQQAEPAPAQQGVKREAAGAAGEEAAGGGDVAAAAVAAAKVCAGKKPSWSKRLKVVKRWASREYIRSLFLAKPSDIVVDGNGSGSVSARGSVLDQEEVCHHRKSFSGIIRRVRLVATKAAATAPPGVSPLCSSSSSSSSSTPSCGNANRFFRPATTPATLKRSSSAGSEEGAIQGAIAHCKRSQQGVMVSGRRSVSDVMFYSVTNTPRASSVAAGEAAQERQEMCRG
ncbi:hypothetical protein ACP70R_031670 [Stipagrostis hirtigluma subsp. patula]